MTAYQCDRCQQTFPGMPLRQAKPNQLIISYFSTMDNKEYFKDLCQDCQNSLVKWLSDAKKPGATIEPSN